MQISRKHVVAYIGLGSNLGDRAQYLASAVDRMDKADGISVLQVSEPVETEPLGAAEQPRYLNAVAEIRTRLQPDQLLWVLHSIEHSLGRVRTEPWQPRTMDLDVLLYGDQVIHEESLIVPHPQMHLRSFVLRGLCQLNAQFLHPNLGETMSTLADRLGGGDYFIDPDRPQLISVAGLIGAGKTTLARLLSDRFGCEMIAEAYDTNPYLPKVCAGHKELALDSQLYFLHSRKEQLIHDRLKSGAIALSDYVFEKDRIFALRTLDEAQYQAYKQQAAAVRPQVAPPVLVLYLQASPEQCLERIHCRNRPYEQGMSLHSLEILNQDYETLFTDWRQCPVIRLDTRRFNCFDTLQLDWLIRQIWAYIYCPDNEE
ncbi:MAG: 2-amino-4-hydroxy-6-hydroxymethyldihydropteridine diphosphokinase [Sedimentisphaerales bacterium]|nr:2-amino-4-hydroxy-6-hydroxymethyldihydropteridine diphosphokinase [Sedimentisphaerales bacterium]